MTKSGSSIIFGTEKLGAGMEASREYLRNNAKVCNEIEKKIKETIAKKALEEK